MNINDFNYDLPERLIAQHPEEKRDNSRLLVVNRKTARVEHKHFYDILDYLEKGDCLVLNNSKVLPARLLGQKIETGAKVEFLLIKRIEGNLWETMVKPGKKLKVGDKVQFTKEGSDKTLIAEIKDFGEEGTRIVEFSYNGVFLELLEEVGSMPLPPYIERKEENEDKDRYQTVYCKTEGSVAAPTAGLHFTKELLEKARAKGVNLAYVTLHVGIGTFRPVKCENIKDHKMHFEEYSIDKENARIINEVKKSGGRIIAVGTTSTRTLESVATLSEEGVYQVDAKEGSTGIFIYPSYEFKMVDCQITNFHLPKSTLLMLISALYDREKILEVYKEAVEKDYRFFSYGDAMMIV